MDSDLFSDDLIKVTKAKYRCAQFNAVIQFLGWILILVLSVGLSLGVAGLSNELITGSGVCNPFPKLNESCVETNQTDASCQTATFNLIRCWKVSLESELYYLLNLVPNILEFGPGCAIIIYSILRGSDFKQCKIPKIIFISIFVVVFGFINVFIQPVQGIAWTRIWNLTDSVMTCDASTLNNLLTLKCTFAGLPMFGIITSANVVCFVTILLMKRSLDNQAKASIHQVF